MKNKFKKILALGLATVMLTSCNKQIFDFNYEFKQIHIYETNKCYPISKWKDYDGEQIQVEIMGKGKIVISSTFCILVQDKCPICD